MKEEQKQQAQPCLVVSTWANKPANEKAWRVLTRNGSALDAVEAGVKVSEADPEEMSVGYGGRPDRDGHVTLDASIMDHDHNCGAVAFLEHIKHPVSIARLVMEKTPHVMLSGDGALQFALENGFSKENLLTERARAEWMRWQQTAEYAPVINIESHDTIGMLALDSEGRMCGACSTSGLAYKMHGRVGDSPLIGAGLYVDGEVGGATGTGLGEGIVRMVGAFATVELMRQGAEPDVACREIIGRILRSMPEYANHQIGIIAVNSLGEYGGYSIQQGFEFTVRDTNGNNVLKAASAL